MSLTLTLIRGLPGSGKSTMAKLLADRGAAHFETDMFFEKSGVFVFDGTLLGAAHEWCRESVEKALREGKDCVVSNTFVKKWELEEYFPIAARTGAVIDVLVATGRYPNTHGVPDSTIERMLSKWEAFP